MPEPWSTRQATPADRDVLYALKERALREYVEAVWGWDDAFQTEHFDKEFDPEHWQVVEVEGTVAGILQVRERPDDVFLVNILLDPVFQGRGIGTEIVRSVRERAIAANKPVTLQVLKVNVRAKALYEREGFKVVDETETHFQMRAG